MSVDAIARGIAASAVSIAPDQKFDTASARDAYFAENPGKLQEQMYIFTASQLQQYIGEMWEDATPAIIGPIGPTGQTGATGETGEQGEAGKDATINGVTTLTIEPGANITIEQEGSTLTISASGGGGGTTNHALLSNLRYELSGHIGFATEAQGLLGASALQPEDLASWAKSPVKPVYTAEEVGAIPEGTELFDGQYDSLIGKPVIPTTTSQLTNNSGFITKVANDLVEYYLKSETYTQTEIDAKIAGIPSWRVLVMPELPEAGEEFVLYLVPNPDGADPDLKTEYIWVEGESRFESIGSTSIDLTGYVTISDLEELYYNKLQADARFEPVIGAKGTAFNKSFGTEVGSVCEGSRVLTIVPLGAKFTDTVYDDSSVVKSVSLGTEVIQPSNNLLEAPAVDLVFTLEDDSTETYTFFGIKKVVAP